MAKRLEILSSIQFSIFRFASSHIPAHAVALIQASAKGTVDGVKYFNIKDRSPNPNATMRITIIHSRALQ